MRPFTYNSLPSRVVFGHGKISQIKSELEGLRCRKALLLTTPQQADLGHRVQTDLGDWAVGLYTNATMHTPVDITEEAVALAKTVEADCIVALGGGSTTGLGKAMALWTGLPQIVLPTTYAGSEATAIIGQTENGTKTTQITLKVLPRVIIYDVNLTLTLPVSMTITSGFNAIAHAVEALYSEHWNPVTEYLAIQGTRSIVNALPRILENPSDKEGRAQALFGAWACGTCLGQASMGVHHKLCHLLGGTFNLPHAEAHTVILPHAIAYNEPYASEAIGKLKPVLGVENVAQGLWQLQNEVGAPMTLQQLGMQEADLERAADLACQKPYPNPAPLERARLLQLLNNAFHGNEPGSV